MRSITWMIGILLLAACAGLAHGADPFDGIRFSDGKQRKLTDLGDQTVVMVYFCGHCPVAGQFMRTQAKAAHDTIEAGHGPVYLVCVTPDLGPDQLKDWAKNVGVPYALTGQDTKNSRQIGTSNILQTSVYRNGSPTSLPGGSLGDAIKTLIDRGNAGTFRFPRDGISSDLGVELWWMAERQRPQALEAILAGRKNKRAQEDAEKVYQVVEASYVRRQEQLVSQGDGFDTYEALEGLLGEATPIRLKPAEERLRELGKRPEIKKELKARAIYVQAQELLQHPNPQKQELGRGAMHDLGQRLADTVYGKRARDGV